MRTWSPGLPSEARGFLCLEVAEELAETSRFQILQRVSSKQSKKTSPSQKVSRTCEL